MDQIEGNKAAFFGKPAWHGKGITTQEELATEAFAAIAYGDGKSVHSVMDLPAYAGADPSKLDGFMQVPDVKHIYRDDGQYLGTVGNGYKLRQPIDEFMIGDPYIQSGLCRWEAGGSLNDGKRMFALMAISDGVADIVPGDAVKAYYLIATSFDGSLAWTMMLTRIRVVCANTLAAAIRAAVWGDDAYRTKHTVNVNSRIDAAQARILSSLDTFQKDVEVYRALAAKKMNYEAMKAYVRNVVLLDQDDEKEISGKMQAKVRRVVDLIDGQRNLDLVPAMKGTAWQAYNAVSEYITHEAGRSDDARLNGQWFGDTARLNSKALEMALAA